MKFYLSLICFCAVTGMAFSQQLTFQSGLGGSSGDQAQSVIKTSNNDYVVFGNSNSPLSGHKSEDSLGKMDYWVVKVDSEGSILWDRTLGGSEDDYAEVVRETPDGGFILLGSSLSNSSPTKSENCLGGNDLYIVKLDANGNIEWEQTIGGSNHDNANDLIVNADGTLVIAASSSSDISFDKTENSVNNDYWILKLSSTGSILWQKTINANSSDLFPVIESVSNGGYIVCGHSQSDAGLDKSEDSRGMFDLWILMLDSTGSILWDKTYGGGNIEWSGDIKQDITGGFVVLGSSDSPISGDKTVTYYGQKDCWLLKLDSIGNIVWQSGIGGNNLEIAGNLLQRSDSTWMVTINSASSVSGNKTVPTVGYRDFWIMNIDTSGAIIWQEVIGTGFNDIYGSAIIDDNDNLVMTGMVNLGHSGHNNSVFMGGSDYWIVEMTTKRNLIRGKYFFDQNLNGTYDAAEPFIAGKLVKSVYTGETAFSNTNGDYVIAFQDTGYYEVTGSVIANCTSIPLVNNAHFTLMGQVDVQNNFAVQPLVSVNDLCATITPTGNFRPGFLCSYLINYQNSGTTTLFPSLVFYPDSNLTFQSASTTPGIITPDSIVWILPPLAPFQSGVMLVTVLVDMVPNGTLIQSKVLILPIAGDANPGCNYAFNNLSVTGSFDPNDILVSRSFIESYELSAPPDIEYLIRFQNTGNDTAFNVTVLHNVSSMLDMNSFEIIASSHPVNIHYNSNPRLLTFSFPDIMLPDSGANEPQSHGFIRYRIKPNNDLAVGDTILQNAMIYFDFNQPIVTNDATTAIILLSSSHDHDNSSDELFVFPNPAVNYIYLERITDQPLYIINVLGEVVIHKNDIAEQGELVRLDISKLSNGIYLIKNGLKTSKLVVKK